MSDSDFEHSDNETPLKPNPLRVELERIKQEFEDLKESLAEQKKKSTSKTVSAVDDDGYFSF